MQLDTMLPKTCLPNMRKRGSSSPRLQITKVNITKILISRSLPFIKIFITYYPHIHHQTKSVHTHPIAGSTVHTPFYAGSTAHTLSHAGTTPLSHAGTTALSHAGTTAHTPFYAGSTAHILSHAGTMAHTPFNAEASAHIHFHAESTAQHIPKIYPIHTLLLAPLSKVISSARSLEITPQGLPRSQFRRQYRRHRMIWSSNWISRILKTNNKQESRINTSYSHKDREDPSGRTADRKDFKSRRAPFILYIITNWRNSEETK